MDAVSAIDEPEMAPKNVEANMFTSDNPPRTKPTSTPANATSRRDMPPSAMMAPASTKHGMASSENLLTPLANGNHHARPGQVDPPRAPISAAMPSAYATGMPDHHEAPAKLPNSTNASMSDSLCGNFTRFMVKAHHGAVVLGAESKAFQHEQCVRKLRPKARANT
jgi:hypothetical protein